MAIITSYPADPTTADGDNFLTSSDDGITRLTPASNINKYIGVGWTISGDSWSFSSYANGIGVINTSAGANTKYSADMRIKFTQPTLGLKYGRIISVTTSTITVQMMNGTTLANEAITAPFYSAFYAPFGYTTTNPSLTDTTLDFIASGGVWTADAPGTTRNASMTAITVYQGGQSLYIPAVAARTFTASVDTYIDVLNTAGVGSLVYTTVATNAASPALAANSLRIGIIPTGASSIATAASVNQGQEGKLLPISGGYPYQTSDSLGNRIAPRRPYRTRIGTFRKTDANTSFTTSYATYMQVIGESYGGDVTVELDLVILNAGSGATRTYTTQVLCDGVAINPASYTLTAPTASAEYPILTSRLNFSHTPAAGKHTWAIQFLASNNSSVQIVTNSKANVKEEA